MKKKWLVIIFAVILLILGVLGKELTQQKQQDVMMDWFANNEINSLSTKELRSGSSDSEIAVLSIKGTIQGGNNNSLSAMSEGYNHEKTLQVIEQIKEDENIKGLVLAVDSPGGTTYHSAELKNKLNDLKAARDIPIYVSMGTTAASGGYMISAEADKIYANKETVTGSIGVIMQMPNYHEFLDEHGIKMTTYKSGDHKDMGSPFKDANKEEQKIFESMIDESYEDFVSVVADGRGMSKNEVKELADGRVYSGQQAKDNGLVDSIGNQDDTIDAMMGDNDLSSARVVDVTPNKEQDFFSQLFSNVQQFISLTDRTDSTANDLKAIDHMIKDAKAPQLYYLYGGGENAI